MASTLNIDLNRIILPAPDNVRIEFSKIQKVRTLVWDPVYVDENVLKRFYNQSVFYLCSFYPDPPYLLFR